MCVEEQYSASNGCGIIIIYYQSLFKHNYCLFLLCCTINNWHTSNIFRRSSLFISSLSNGCFSLTIFFTNVSRCGKSCGVAALTVNISQLLQTRELQGDQNYTDPIHPYIESKKVGLDDLYVLYVSFFALQDSFFIQFWSILTLVVGRHKDNWRAPWKNWKCSTTTKLRISLVKPVTWQKPAIIKCCSVVPPKIIMHDAYIGGCSENNIWRAGCSRLQYVDIHSVYLANNGICLVL